MFNQYDQDRAIKSIKLNMIFADFLDKLMSVITAEAYYEIAVLVIFYKRALDEVGWQKLRENMLREGKPFNESWPKEFKYCEKNNGEFAPEICNIFAAELLQKYMNELDLQRFKILGKSNEKM